jgi:hypothetical protein
MMGEFVDTKVINVQSAAQLDTILTKPVAITTKPREQGSDLFARWGDGNDFPQMVIEDVNKDPEIKTMLRKSAELLYGGGIKFGRVVYDAKGNEALEPLDPATDLKIRTWLRKSNFNRYVKEAALDLYYFGNVFPELILNVGRTEIVQIAVRAAETCRYSRMNTRGVIEKCYVSYQWPSAKPKDEYTKEIPVLDPYYNPAEQLTQKTNGTNFIFPLSEPSPGNNYYQLTDWNAIRTSGWLSFSQSIPKYKQNIIKNQFGVRFVVEVNTKYFEWRFPGWNTKTDTEKAQIKEEERKKWENFCTGEDSVGKVITINFFGDGQQKDISMVKFTPIKNVIEKNEYIEDGQQASTQKAIAVGLHPALLGFLPNSGLGGAGSNIREAYNLHVIMNKSKQDLLLEPLYCVRDFNAWGDDIGFAFNNTLMTTLDAGKETKKLDNATN